MDPYGGSNPVEFFAVATECFFEKPKQLCDKHPELYAALKQFYKQDPAAWVLDPQHATQPSQPALEAAPPGPGASAAPGGDAARRAPREVLDDPSRGS
jgi:hypothetical protein